MPEKTNRLEETGVGWKEMREEIEAALAAWPIVEYAYLPVEEISFLQRVRDVCRNECPRYNSTWSCPPAVGSVDECRERCLRRDTCFVFTTIAEVSDITNLEETLPTRMAHEEVTWQVLSLFRRYDPGAFALSTESCDICPVCTWPAGGPCRHPGRMFPCVESYGILVTELAEKGQITFNNGANVVTWFSVIFFGDRMRETAKGSEDKPD